MTPDQPLAAALTGQSEADVERACNTPAAAWSCPSATGPGPCRNPAEHQQPRGCVHHSTSGIPDRHDRPDRGDSE